MNIAILSASREVQLIKRFRTLLHHNGGGNLHALDVAEHRAALFFADQTHITPYSTSSEFIPFLLDFCETHDIDLIFSCRDEDLLVLAQISAELAQIGTKAMVADLETIKICHNKKLFHDFCIANNFEVPVVYNRNTTVFPAFIKPVSGKGSINAFRVTDKRALNGLLEAFGGEFIIQECIEDPEYTIDLFADFDGRVISVLPRERILTVGGESYIGKTYKNSLLINEAIRLATALGLVGHNTIQCFFDGDIIKFIEVNPRFGGGANLGFAAGHNSPEYLIRLIRGKPVESAVGDFEDGLIMLRYAQDLFVPAALPTNKTFCVDIDGTLCTEGEEYHLAKPIEKAIKKVNLLHAAGNTIILFTARGVWSNNDWGALTSQQLQRWGVKYHSLQFKKPFADYYIDNKACDVLDWV